jgi:hypothetical protein
MNVAQLSMALFGRGWHAPELEPDVEEQELTPPLAIEEITARLKKLLNNPDTPAETRQWAGEWLRGFDGIRAI